MTNGFLGSSLQGQTHRMAAFVAAPGPAPVRIPTTIEAAHKKVRGVLARGIRYCTS